MNSDWIGPETQGVIIDGVNSSVRPDLVGPRQASWMMNSTVRDGKPRTRPGIVQKTSLPQGRVQGAGFFSIAGGMIVLSIRGFLYRVLIEGDSFTVENIPLDFDNNPDLPIAYMVETNGNFLIQDGQNACIIYDGSIARRANQSLYEVPVGKQMAYGNGRLFVAVDANDIVAGNITDGSIANSELFFTENTYLFGGGAFYYPRPISGMAFLPTNNTSSGYGSLMIFGTRFTDSLRAEVAERDLWQIIPGFQLIVLDGIGTVSHLSITKVNQDLYWRDVDGQIRSLRSAAFDAMSPGNAPQSREVVRVTDFETDEWLEETSGIYFDNRLLFTASPKLYYSTGSGNAIDPPIRVFSRLISLDCAPLATMQGKAPPAYDGEWQGLNFVRLVEGDFNGRRRAFAISTDPDGGNRLWEFDSGQQYDSYLTGSGNTVDVPIKSYAEFRRFNFGNPSQYKQLVRCDIYPADIQGEVSIELQWRADNRTQWLSCDEVDFCAKMTDASTADPHVWKNLNAQERGRVRSYTFPDSVDPITKIAQTCGFGFQIRLVITGQCLVDRIDIYSRPLITPQFSNIADLDTACVENDVQGNEIVYSILP